MLIDYRIGLILASYQGHLVEITKNMTRAGKIPTLGSTTKSTLRHAHLADPLDDREN